MMMRLGNEKSFRLFFFSHLDWVNAFYFFFYFRLIQSVFSISFKKSLLLWSIARIHLNNTTNSSNAFVHGIASKVYNFPLLESALCKPTLLYLIFKVRLQGIILSLYNFMWVSSPLQHEKAQFLIIFLQHTHTHTQVQDIHDGWTAWVKFVCWIAIPLYIHIVSICCFLYTLFVLHSMIVSHTAIIEFFAFFRTHLCKNAMDTHETRVK